MVNTSFPTTTPPPPPPPTRVTLPALTDSTWKRNGVATAITGGVQLTPATTNVAGSVFNSSALTSNGLTASFTTSIAGGSSPGGSGADGLTLALLDATTASASSVGATGGGLGWSGLGGVAVSLDSYQNTGDPGADFVGIATGVRASDQLSYLATTTPGGGLTAGIHVVEVTASGGRLTVKVDGTVRLDQAVTLPPKVLVGFTAGTGGLVNVHSVTGVTVSAPA